jgi:hypothetical protein
MIKGIARERDRAGSRGAKRVFECGEVWSEGLDRERQEMRVELNSHVPRRKQDA